MGPRGHRGLELYRTSLTHVCVGCGVGRKQSNICRWHTDTKGRRLSANTVLYMRPLRQIPRPGCKRACFPLRLYAAMTRGAAAASPADFQLPPSHCRFTHSRPRCRAASWRSDSFFEPLTVPASPPIPAGFRSSDPALRPRHPRAGPRPSRRRGAPCNPGDPKGVARQHTEGCPRRPRCRDEHVHRYRRKARQKGSGRTTKQHSLTLVNALRPRLITCRQQHAPWDFRIKHDCPRG
jgi:hypothetical protein